MIEEKEPPYFKEFRNLVVKRFDQLEVKIEKEVESLALSTANQFKRIDERFDEIDLRFDGVDQRLDRLEIRIEAVENVCDGLVHNMAGIKKNIEMIEVYIGGYEVRATNFEQIVLQDLRPRIVALEKLA